MFTIEELERLEDVLIAFDCVAAFRDVEPFENEGADCDALYLLVSKAKAKLKMEQEQQKREEQGEDAGNDNTLSY